MKKKAIEQVPYMVPERKEGCKYVARANVPPIGGTETLLIEIFGKSDIPEIRTVITKTDYATYDPKKQKWSKAGTGCAGMKGNYDYYVRFEERNCIKSYIPKADEEKIVEFTKDYNCDKQDWVGKVKAIQESIRDERRRKLEAKRSLALADRIANTPELPQEVVEWAATTLVEETHILFYRRKGNRVTVHCSACRGTIEGRYKASEDPYNFERIIKPQPEHEGECPACGAKGTWKSEGRASEKTISANFYAASPYKENGAVIRYFTCGRTISPPKNGEASECFWIEELIRQYFYDGKMKKDYHKIMDIGEYWDDRNYSMYGPVLRAWAAVVYPGTWDELKGTCLQYSGGKEYAGNEKVYLMDYMENYRSVPQLEMISKLGLKETAKEIARWNRQVINDAEAKNIGSFLGIYKEDLRILQKAQGDMETLRILKAEKRFGQHWAEHQIKFLVKMHAQNEDITEIQWVGIQRFINKSEKYAGIKLEDCEMNRDLVHLMHIARTYADYLRMRRNGGYDMHNTVYLYPRDLERAHAEMVTLQNERLRQAEEGKAELAYPNIAKAYKGLNRWYHYEYKDWIIRPAKSATEIIEEGREMHHCVGGPTYLGRHNSGQSFILLMRWKDNPDIPYVTIEIEGTTIKQWYQKNDRKPDAAIIDPWLKGYIKMLKGKEEQIWTMCS